MSMVQIALRRPYAFIVMALLIVLATPFALRSMATDIFPEINIPVISIIWNATAFRRRRWARASPRRTSAASPPR
jgi:multidrug efflux pump subunit AcrB